eukprot:scaffold21612_cov69-Phaeocystis_antarctica.AAC.1
MLAQSSQLLFVSAHGRSGGREGGENGSQQPVQSQPEPSSSLHRSRPKRAPHVVVPHPMSQLGVFGGADCGIWTAKSRGNHCGGHATPRTRSIVFELREGKPQLGVGVIGLDGARHCGVPGSAAPSYSNCDGTVFHALPVPERRGLRDDGAEDSGGAEEDEGAAHDAMPCLVVEIGGSSWASCQGGKNGHQATSAESGC